MKDGYISTKKKTHALGTNHHNGGGEFFRKKGSTLASDVLNLLEEVIFARGHRKYMHHLGVESKRKKKKRKTSTGL